MPHFQDPGPNGHHAFTAFIRSGSLFVRFTLAHHFDPAQYLKHHTASHAKTYQPRQPDHSMFCWTVPRQLPAPMNKSRRSFAEAAITVAYPGVIAALG
jgi:hypothetical protein